MTKIETETALGRFIAATRDLFERETDPETRWTQLAPALRELLANEDVQAAASKWPSNVFTDRAENLLFYEDPDYGFVINGLKREVNSTPAVNPEHPTALGVHDHAHIYTLYGVLVGHEMIERYKAVDGVERRDDFVKIEQVGDFQVEPGAVDLVRPFEIHAERGVGEQTVAVIIRSEKPGGFLQGRYDAQTGEYWQGFGPRQREIEMLG
jgi:predicted metal-dependent enzyme (double-stranded beta helix superfamily)